MTAVSQTLFLLYTQLVLKSWNLLLFPLLLLVLLFAIQCSHYAFSSWSNVNSKDRIKEFSGSTISSTQPSIIFTDELPDVSPKAMLQILKSMDPDFKDDEAPWKCSNRESCVLDLYSSMMHSGNHQQKYFIDHKRNAIVCPAVNSFELHCSLFGSILKHSRSVIGPADWFKNYNMFQLTSTASDIGTDSNSPYYCTDDINYFLYLPQLLTFVCVLVLTLVCAYFLVTTISCITELKRCGLLQLMTRKGLSPSSYWSSLWIWMSVEIILLSVSLTMSFYIQCPGFYSLQSLFVTFIVATTNLFCAAAFMLLLTVLTKNYYAICKCSVAYVTAVGLLALGNRLANEIEFVASKQLRIVVLLLPCGNFAEQLRVPLVGPSKPGLDDKFHVASLAINVLLAIFYASTAMYFDCVLTTGNGLRYHWSYLCCKSSDTSALPVMPKLPPSIEPVDNGEVLVRLVQVSGTSFSANEDPGQFSVDLYDSQITAVLSDDTRNVNGFTGILTGRQPITCGQLWIDGCTAAEGPAKRFSRAYASECPPEDALCGKMTVLHTLQMALVSGGVDWATSEQEIHPTLTLLRLVDVLSRPVSSLSSGQARNLSIACALLGSPRLVVLCEPTRHMDPASRQRLWRLLEEHRLRHRCIVLGVAAQSPGEIDEMTKRANRLIFLASPSGRYVACAGSPEHIRKAMNCEMIVQAHLRDASQGAAALQKLQSSLSSLVISSVQLSLQADLLSARFDSRLADKDANLLSTVLNGFKAIEQNVVRIGLNRLSLSETFNRLKQLSSRKVENLFLNTKKSGKLTESSGTTSVGNESEDIKVQSAGEKVTMPTTFLKNEINEPEFLNATREIFRFNCMLYRRSCCRLFCQSIFMPIVLLGFLAATLLVEKNWLSSFRISHNASDLHADEFTRGVCIHDSDVSPDHKIDQHRCSLFLKGSAHVGNNYLAIQKDSDVALRSFLQSSSTLKKIHSHCKTVTRNELPCPVVYADSWSKATLNKDRQLFIGSYSAKIRPEFPSASAYATALSALNYFMPSNRNTSSFDLIIVQDYRSIVLPLVGQTCQIFIVSILPAYYISDLLQHKAIRWPSFLASIGVSLPGYLTSQLLIHWLQYAPVYCATIIIKNIINPTVYGTKHQWLPSFLVVTFGLINNLLVVYMLSLILSYLSKVITILYLLMSIFISYSTIFLQASFVLSGLLIFAMPPFATAMLSYYSAKLHRYSIEFFSVLSNGGDTSQSSFAVYDERHILMCLIAIPLHTVLLIALVILYEPAKKRLSQCSAGADKQQPLSNSNATDGDNAESAAKSESSHKQEDAVQLKNVTKQFSPGVSAIKDVTLSVNSGEVLCLIGSTGSGMTTLMSAIAGRLRPTNGECQLRTTTSGSWISGRSIKLSSSVTFSQHRSPFFKAATVAEHINLYASLLGVSPERQAQLIKDFYLGNCQTKRLSQLSPAQKRRLSLLITLMTGKRALLVFDDVSTSVNTAEQMYIWEAVVRNRCANLPVILSAHDLNAAETVASSVALINGGKLVSVKTPAQLRKSFAVYILEIELAVNSGASSRDAKVKILSKIVEKFFETSVLDQTVSWIKIAVPEKYAQPPIESLNWLMQLKSQLEPIAGLLFYPASSDQLLEYAFDKFDRQASDRGGEGLAAPPMVKLPQFYDV